MQQSLGMFTPSQSLRNRVAHHEPIIMWNLSKHYDKFIELTGWLSPPAAEWCEANSRFRDLYPAERIKLESGVTGLDARRRRSQTGVVDE